MKRLHGTNIIVMLLSFTIVVHSEETTVQFIRAGAAAVDISPVTLPALRNGGFLQASSDRVDDPLYARCLVVSDGKEIVAIVIVDSCMFSTTLCDEIKNLATRQTGIPANRILISATHTHSAPAAMSFCLGCGQDDAYVKFVPARVAQSITDAQQNLQPAKIGWMAVDGSEFTNCRRWITRSDRMGTDPFGGQTVRAMMHPGYQNPDYVCPAGPIDPWLSVLSVLSAKDETPICVIANLSMHYFGGGSGFSSDYYGEVARLLKARIDAASGKHSPDFVGIMSQGTSGDLHWMDYSNPRKDISRLQYSEGVADRILATWKTIKHQSNLTLSMAEKRLTIGRRIPSRYRLEWARPINKNRGDVPPRNQVEVYAEQAEWIQEYPEAEVVLQAVRIGGLGIAAIPNEVYGITGLKLKRQSPLSMTFNLELANGGEGYIPPPEQHRLGGYTTWPARSAGLDEQAEPLIVETLLELLESVSGKPRKPLSVPTSAYSKTVTKMNPTAFWRMSDMDSTLLADATGRSHAQFKGGVALFLPGPNGSGFAASDYGNRCVYLAGGHIEGRVAGLADDYSVSLWFWNGIPSDAREVTGTLLSTADATLRIAGKAKGDQAGRLVLSSDTQSFFGKTRISSKEWHQLSIIKKDDRVRVYLDGGQDPEIDAAIKGTETSDRILIGSDGDSATTFDGKIDEVAVFTRAIAIREVMELYDVSGTMSPQID